ncbi:uncharacterized protein C8Q71DRAFT_465102 [Rhodofomes roseus]|uniref:Uncharacterized protein n=1 Tax=Rhodofomes roseus TaxID=34475 RepID=A0ABQ8KNE1_9APHY|nr:uncharacterized protein C8Q71DRAFT_465102 [Rhodofomes roseus]KAH9839846.1 hypothetical protein C8Q71DRAFT_465102 [Rhodofomes roseus]
MLCSGRPWKIGDTTRINGSKMLCTTECTMTQHEATLLEEVTHLKTLLEDRRQELKDAQRFMGTMDTFAESDVVREVHSLNTEIFNLARSIADNASQHSPTQIQASERDAAETTIHILGRHFATMLESTDTRGDTILLEIAIQVVVTGFLYEVVSAWTIGHDGNGILASVYGRIRAYENQSVAGQWRALTRKFAQDKHINPAQMEEILTRDLAALLQHVMTLSRMSLSTRHNPQPSLHTLIGKALKIRHLVGEAMKSSEYEALLPQPEAAFVPGEMEDAYAPRGAGRRAGLSVMCCVSLGLRRVEKSEEGLRSVTLIKSEVGLQTLLEDLGVAGEDDEDMSA